MRNFDYKKLSWQTWDNDILLLCSKIHECKGRQDLFVRQKPAQLGRTSVFNALKKLNEEGFIDKHGEGKGSFYVQKSESIW